MTIAPEQPTKKPPHLTPPGLQHNNGGDSSNKFIVLLLILLALTIGCLIYGVIVILPEKSAAPTPTDQPTISATSVPPTSLEKDNKLLFKQQAQERLKQFFELQNSFEAENIDIWGADKYEYILEKIIEGDAHLVSEMYLQAEQAYRQARDNLNSLLLQKETIFKEALREGAYQISNKNNVLAQKAYAIALALAPQDKVARQGAQRAENLERVLNLFTLGEKHEENGLLELALKAFQESHDLDEHFKPAASAIHRISEKLMQLKVTESLSLFYASFHNNNLDQAETALQQAAGIQPNDPDVIKATEEFNRAKRKQTVVKLRTKAENEIASEEWAKALDTYTRVLKHAPQADFALEGQKAVRENLNLSNRLDYFLNNKQRLQNQDILKNAETTLQYAASRSSTGPVMAAKISALETTVIQEKTPVKLTLTSDNLTNVTIYHVGRMGIFLQKDLMLRPGQYTIVGQRNGYRDVRHTVTISHDNPTVTFFIACKETF